MSSICFYFQVHQPYRLKKMRYFDNCADFDYFDDAANEAIMKKVAAKCYLPTNKLLLSMINRYGGAFKISFAVTGVAIEQMKSYSPETLESFQALADTGCVEFISETYYHSLAAVYSEREFYAQVDKHRKLMKELFNQEPKVFRNTELIYNNRIGGLVADMGYSGVIAEGADDILAWRSPNFHYQVPGTSTRLLLKNYRLSDDIAFRFSNQSWAEFPLTSEKFTSWVHAISGNGDVLNLFMDYETFGEHQWESTGIFNFLDHLPEKVLRHPDWNFATVSETIERYPVVSDLSIERLTSWADADRDLTAWCGNKIQESALMQIYELEEKVLSLGSDKILDCWRKLLTSDHFYYMCTKWFADGDVHAYFSPYDSPYDAFIYFSNALNAFKQELGLVETTSIAV